MPGQPLNPLTNAPGTAAPDTEQRAVGSFPSAILLAFTGGSLDAFVYVNHGHVFATAMTGNGVLLGVSILHHDYAEAFHRLVPIFGFMLGVFLSHLLDKTLKHHTVTVGLGCEISSLVLASFLPGRFPDPAFVLIIAIVAAFQVASFRKADIYAYNSTFITGNLRTAVDGLYNALDPATRKAGLRKFFELSCIVLAFITGATAGAILSPHLYNHTLWLINLPLLAVLLLTLRRARRSSQSLATKEGEPALHPGPP
jgi:uncharacterized membrane protein YoaK (UPF0700 family)